MAKWLQINPGLDRAKLAEQFARTGRVQVPDVLTADSAADVRELLRSGTPWLLTWSAGAEGPHTIRPNELATMRPEEMSAVERKIIHAALCDEFCYVYSNYPLDIAYQQRWNPGSAHEQLLEELRGEDFVSLLRDISGHEEIVSADGYATLYGPGNFLSRHDDMGAKWRRVVAYVLNLTFVEWSPEFGGYLTFYDENGDVEQAFRPRFNTLNLFSVPQMHAVTRVAPFAPHARAAISGWARDTVQPPR